MKLKPLRSRVHVACALAALGSAALLAGGVLASPAAAWAGRARVPKSTQRAAARLPNRSHRALVPKSAQPRAGRLPNSSAPQAAAPKAGFPTCCTAAERFGSYRGRLWLLYHEGKPAQYDRLDARCVRRVDIAGAR